MAGGVARPADLRQQLNSRKRYVSNAIHAGCKAGQLSFGMIFVVR
jgi:hypothetical protein